MLKKTGKRDYSIPKHYRPIALLNIIGKMLESILATRIEFIANKHTMLSKSHMGGRKKTSVEATLHISTNKIHINKTQKLVTIVLFLVGSGVYDNVSQDRSLHNLRKRRMKLVSMVMVSQTIRSKLRHWCGGKI